MLELESATQPLLDVHASADLQSARNWKRNLAALAATQGELAASLLEINLQVEWIFARDGTLTALERGKWWGNCSVPLKAAEELLKTLQITSSMACFLAPSHPAQIAFALRRLKREQAIVALLGRIDDLALALHCHDFSDEISSHRLWFASGDQWPAQMLQLFRSNPGLAIPQQFIRTALLSEDISAPLIAAAQKIFIDELNRRSNSLSQLRQTRPLQTRSDRKRITLAAPMRFRLWDDSGLILQDLAASDAAFNWTIINFDDPIHASPLALANAVAESDAILTVNLTRAECGQFLHPQIPLITWLTTPSIPPFATAGPHDMLLLPEARTLELAKKTGWPASRLSLASWPEIANTGGSDHLAIIADTRPIESNPALDLSSHQLLWNLIRGELESNPAIINGDVINYLRSRMNRLGVTDHGLDQRRFIEDLIVPSFAQSIAAQLIQSKLPIRIFGEGWKQIPAFASLAAGPITSREELKHAVSSAAAVIHLWPANHAHPIDAAGPPVIRLASGGITAIIADARLALTSRLKPTLSQADSIDVAAITRTLRAVLGQ